MFFYQGLICPHCGKPFDEHDDIVACPICGAPHHRDCWKERRGCACADAHGTDRQWSRETATPTPENNSDSSRSSSDAVQCPQCNTENSPYAERCSRCGAPLKAQDWHSNPRPHHAPPPTGYHEYSPHHYSAAYCGGVNPDADIEGESAKDLGAVVRTNVGYYLPRFERMAVSGNKLSWNWAAFLFSSLWLLFRKQYLAGILMLLLEIFNAITVSLAMSLFPSVLEKTSYADRLNELLFLMQADPRAESIMRMVSLLCLVMLIIRIALAMLGNRLYMKQCLRTVAKARNGYPEGYQAQLSIAGGTSYALALVGYMAWYLLPDFILMLILR